MRDYIPKEAQLEVDRLTCLQAPSSCNEQFETRHMHLPTIHVAHSHLEFMAHVSLIIHAHRLIVTMGPYIIASQAEHHAKKLMTATLVRLSRSHALFDVCNSMGIVLQGHRILRMWKRVSGWAAAMESHFS